MPLDPGIRLGPYAVEALIGRGGMGEVYRARDTRLGRLVALKVLPQRVAGDREYGERFDREARVVASLSHPNICPLFDVGSDGGVRYLVMEHLDGETLADRLQRGPLPVGEALRFGGQIADALTAAHALRIVHRDLKPANVKLTPSGAKVLDFGLARVLEADAPSVDPAERDTKMETREHTVLGTAAYMAPEQARGGRVDHRADAWSFGVVLYEMLTGHPLFRGETTVDVMAAVLRESIALSSLPAETPKPVRDLLAELLERDPERRCADMAAAAARIRAEGRPEPAATSSRLAVAEPHAEGRISVVVLPFVNSSPDPDNEYFSDGLTEEVIADLSKVGALRVISRTTAMRLKGTDKDMATVARELDVRYALEGSVRKMGTSLRITAQLVDTRSDETVWSDKYGGTIEDVFEIQERVSRSIVGALRIKLNESEDRGLHAPSGTNAFAYDTYLRCRRDVGSFVPERLEKAERELKHALSVVGDDVYLYTGLSMVHWQFVNSSLSADPGHLEEARRYAEKVIEIDPDGALGPKLLGFIAMQSRDIAGWARNMQRALEKDPHDPDTLVWLALCWVFAGYPEKARPLFDRLQSTDPYFDYLHFGLGFMAYFAGDYDGTLSCYERAQQLSPDHPGWAMCMVQTLASAGRTGEAIRLADVKAPAPSSHPLAGLTHFMKFALLGNPGAADALVSPGWTEKIRGDFQYVHVLAQAQAILGRTDEALDCLAVAVDRGFCHHAFLARDPLLANLRGDARFLALLDDARRQRERFEREAV